MFVLLLSATIRGILRGTVAQVFAFFGLVAGIFTAAWLARWVGGHWQHARPALVFGILRWVIAALGGLALTTLIAWWGEHVGESVREGPLGWLDRVVGGGVGLVFGAAIAAVLVLVALEAPGFGFARNAARMGRTAHPLVRMGTGVTAWRGMPVPGAGWLHGRFVSAERQMSR